MAYPRKVSKSFTTTAGGAATEYTEAIRGKLIEVIFTDGSTDAGADFTITTEDSGQAILTLTNAGAANGKWRPRQKISDATGADISYEATDAKDVHEPIRIANERIKIVVAQGGNAKTGTFAFIYE